VAFRIMTMIAQKFRGGDRPATACEIADAISVPSRLVSRILEPLVRTRIVVEVAGEKKDELGYTPGRPLETISCQNILDSIRCGTGQEVATKADSMCEVVRGEFDKIMEAESHVASTITLDQLVRAEEKMKSELAAERLPIRS
jgi:DNA-binding IscR family transcriptional regulator